MVNVSVIHGDMRDVLGRMVAEGKIVQSIVTDPPYHLTNITLDFARDQHGIKRQRRAERGFMGKAWDGGDIAFQPGTWRLCFELLPPGGHLLAFAGTRTYHRMAVAIEEAGFEMRDTIAWLYGSGFPKSLNVSKAIDRRCDWQALAQLHDAIRAARLSLGISQSEAARRCGLIGLDESLGGGGFMWFESGMRIPTREQWPRLRDALFIGDAFDNCFAEAEREVIGQRVSGDPVAWFSERDRNDGISDITIPATAAARQWDGWGTALKPAMELICVARKPLDGTVAATVLKHGTGALNIDACRVATADDLDGGAYAATGLERSDGWGMQRAGAGEYNQPAGRWPANVVHDGSDEVVSAFEAYGDRPSCGENGRSSARSEGMFGHRQQGPIYEGNGSAARFFYSSKADADDRLGSKHPTIKPVDLMRWLVRLVTPPGGTVLDPFAGSGATGMACMAEGLDCILVEREAEYIADIKARIAHVHGDDTPLFGGVASPVPTDEPVVPPQQLVLL